MEIEIEKMNLYQKISKIRDITDAIKKNKSGYGYKYVSEDEILARVKAGMSKYHVTIYPAIQNGTVDVLQRDYQKKKFSKAGDPLPPEDCVEYTTKSYLNMHIVNDDIPDDTIVVPWYMVATSSDTAQSFGSALTYANRYFLLKFFDIATPDDDPDAWRKKKQEAMEKENSEAVQLIVAKIDSIVKANTNDSNKKNVIDLIKRYVVKEDGKPSANYFDLKDLDSANKLMSELITFFNTGKEEK